MGVDVLAVMSPVQHQIVEPSQWRWERTVDRECPTVDVSDEWLMPQKREVIHMYTHDIHVTGSRPRVALVDADKLSEARAAVAELIEAGKEFDQCDSRDVQVRFRAALAKVTGATDGR